VTQNWSFTPIEPAVVLVATSAVELVPVLVVPPASSASLGRSDPPADVVRAHMS